MNRRTFLCGLTLGTVSAPLAVEAQQGRVPVIGVIRNGSKPTTDVVASRFRRDMQALGWEDERKIRYIFLWRMGAMTASPRWPPTSSRDPSP